MSKKFVLMVIILASGIWYPISVLFAATSKTGTTTASFLKIEPGTRPMGMGGAFTGVADDINAVSWNPGGLFQVKKREAIVIHTAWLEKLNHEYAAFVNPLGNRFTYGFSVVYFGTNDIDRRTEAGISDGKARVQNYSAAGTCGIKLHDQLGLGATVKYIAMKLDKNESAGVAFDIGVLQKITSRLSLGVVGQNIGGKIKIDSTAEKLPWSVKVGIGYHMVEDKLLLSTDVDFPNDRELKFHFGSEYKFNKFFTVRAGYEDVGSLGNSSGLSAGISVYEDVLDEILELKMKFDYSWLYFGNLGSTHRLAVGFLF